LARASGVKRDLRKDDPYLCFVDNWDGQGAKAVDFKVPIATTGDCLARYHVRLEEIRQSCDIISQLIDNIPSGPVNASPSGNINMPDKKDVYNSIEGTIQLFEMVMPNCGFDSPVGESYSAIEGANGEMGFFIVSAGGVHPWRVAPRPCSFINFQVFAKMFEGHQLADLVAILGSLNIIAAELDR
jgi:NADH-quinone oxidoreductase subunit D